MHIVRQLRLDHGWSQEDLAAVSGVSVRTIQRLENGGRASLETLKCLAAAFESDVSILRETMTMNATTNDTRMHASGLNTEDRAALQFARQLRAYAELESDEMPGALAIRQQVRRERGFYIHAAIFVAVMALLFAIDLFTSPGRFWAQWPLLGWGVGLSLHALAVFGGLSPFGADWERRKVEERLRRLADDKGGGN